MRRGRRQRPSVQHRAAALIMPERNPQLPRLALLTLRCAGALTALFGGVALLGWHLHDRVLIQVYPLFAPMPYIMALGLVCLGAGYVFLDRWPMVAAGAAAGGVILGLAGYL